MRTSEVLYEAANLIESRGWAHGGGWGIFGEDDPLCLEGAISVAMGFGEEFERVWQCPAALAVKSYLSDWVTAQSSLYQWNDGLRHGLQRDGSCTFTWPGGSPESASEYARGKVIATLRAAALLEQAKEAEATTQPAMGVGAGSAS